MCVEREKRDKSELQEAELAEFEGRLRMAMRRKDAPLGLKARVLARAREQRSAQHGQWRGEWMVQRVAAMAVLAAIFGGVAVYRQAEVRAAEQAKAEAARDQVLLALRITNRALNRIGEHMNERTEDDGR
jgi:hypothetical protein